MARGQQSTEVTLVTLNEKIQELNVEQLRILVILMATGQGFTEAYLVAQTYATTEKAGG
jgi:hypothetical protein